MSAYVAALCTIQVAGIGLSLARVDLSRGLAMGILTAGLAVGGGLWLVLGRASGSDRLALPGSEALRRAVWLITAYCLGCYALLWFAAYVRPDVSFDGNTYHIPTIHQWARAGYVHWIAEGFSAEGYMNGYPKGVELVAFVLDKALGSSQWVNAINLVYLPLGGLGTALISAHLGVPTRVSVAAGACLVLIPVNVHQSITTYVDTAFSGCTIAFAALVVHTLSRARCSDRVRWSVAAGGSAGLLISAKSTGLAYVAAGALVAAVVVLPRLRTISRDQWRKAFAKAVLLFSAAGLVAACVGGFWYVRNYLMAGNPLYPVQVSVAQHTLWPGLRFTYVPEGTEEWSAARRVLWSWVQGGGYRPLSASEDSRLVGLGYAWLLGGIPSVALVLYWSLGRQGMAPQRASILTLVGLTVAFFAVTPWSWTPRYTSWLYGLGLPCMAVVVSRLAAGLGGGRLLRLWMWACLAVLVIEGSTALRWVVPTTFRGSWRSDPMGALAREHWQWPICEVFPPTCGTVLDEILEGSEDVAIGPIGMQGLGSEWWSVWKPKLLGQLMQPIGRRDVVPLPPDASPEAAKRAMSRGVRYLVWDDVLPIPAAFAPYITSTQHVAGFRVLTLAAP